MQDFFGKVKDKAENMERMIKEKDKHGKSLWLIRVFFLIHLFVLILLEFWFALLSMFGGGGRVVLYRVACTDSENFHTLVKTF